MKNLNIKNLRWKIECQKDGKFEHRQVIACRLTTGL